MTAAVAIPGADLVADDALAHLQALLKLDTTNPPGNEKPAIDYIADRLREVGVEPTLFEPGPGRANLVARLKGDGSGPPLLLTSHVDVVPVEPEKWTRPPFSGEVADGFVWGRGAVDMKGMTAHELAIFRALARAGKDARLGRDVILLALADEENGMTYGSTWMVENEPDAIRAEYALNEVGGMNVDIGDRRLYPVQVAEKGMCWMRIRARGEPGHGSVPLDESAVTRVVAAVERLRAPLGYRLTDAARAFLVAVAEALGYPKRVAIDLLQSRATAGLALGLLPAEQRRHFRAMLNDTANPTGLRAGKKTNVIPSEAEATIDGRLLPGTTVEGFLAEVRRRLGPEIEVDVECRAEPTEVPLDTPLFRKIDEVVRRHDQDGRAVPWLTVGFTDGANLQRIGIRPLGFSPCRFPPDVPWGKLVHGHDERVPVEGYRFGTRMLYDVVKEWVTKA